MIKHSVILVLALLTTAGLSAQRFCYVNSDFILNQMDDYTKAQEELDKVADGWRKEVDSRKAEIAKMYQDFRNDQVLLTEEQEELRIQEIEAKERELKDFQKAKFGYEGELFTKRQELIKPIQDKVYAAIEQYANERNYEFIFDRANSTTLLYANPKNDKTQDVLKRLGVSGN